MPDGRTHGRIGAVVGGAASLIATYELPNDGRVAATLAGLFAGYAGGKAPDILEPPIHGWHRSECHSFAAGAAVIATGVRGVIALKDDMLGRAAELKAARLALPPNHPDQFSLWIREFGIYVAYGAVVGFAAGYTSHLLLDGGTERGIPLISQKLI